MRQALDGWNIAGTWFCENDEEIAYNNTMEILSDPSITGIAALNEIVTME